MTRVLVIAAATAAALTLGGAAAAKAPPPKNTSPPTISGTPQQGQTLTASPGTWTGQVTSYAYQWLRCDTSGGTCSAIAGGTAPKYLLASTDVSFTIRVAVTASNSSGSSSAQSAPTAIVQPPPTPPANKSPPTVSGTAQDGQTLRANTGTWSGTAPLTYAYQWLRCDASGGTCGAIVGATASTYVVVSADVGSTLSVAITASNAGGSSTATSAPTAVVSAAPPANASPPTISGTAQEGQTLTAHAGAWSGTPPLSFAYQWRSCDTSGAGCVDIVGATGTTYVLTPADVGSTIRVAVTATNAAGSTSANSNATAVVTAPVSGDPVVAAAGDIACDPSSSSYNGGLGTSNACRQLYTSNMLVGAGLAGVLVLGDNQYYCGGLTAFQQVYDPTWGRVKSITYPSPGNHEYLTSGGTGCDASNAGAAGYFNYFGASAASGWYSTNIGTWHIISLNSNCGDAGGCGSTSPQGKWLQADLGAHANMCTLAFWHIPLFSSGGRASPNSQPFWNMLYAAHADVVLNGHDHIYERFAPQDPSANYDPVNGIREFIVGTGGANHTSIVAPAANSDVTDATTYGVLELTLHQGSYGWQFVPDTGSGSFTDSGSASCHTGSQGTDATPPSVPTGLTANPVTSSEVDLSWTASSDNAGGSGVAGYRIYRSDHGSTPLTTVSGTSYADTGLAANTTYTYAVSAFDNAGNESAQSQPVSATTQTGGGGGGGTVQLVQQKALGGTGLASLQVPLPAASGAGHALVAAVALAAGSSASVSSVTDSAGGTWTKGPVGFLTGTNTRVEMWYSLGAPSVTSVTVTLSAAKSIAVNVSEWSGVSSSVDVSAGGNSASSTTVQTPSVSTSNASDLVIGAVNFPASATSTLNAGPFTGLNDFNASTSVHGRAAYAMTSSTGSFQAAWTLNALSGGNGGIILAFKAG